MKKFLLPAFGATLVLFGSVVANRATAEEKPLEAQQCDQRSGDWFCFYYRGVAYYSKCTTTYPGQTECGVKTNGTPPRADKRRPTTGSR
jgi:hypothetical protein